MERRRTQPGSPKTAGKTAALPFFLSLAEALPLHALYMHKRICEESKAHTAEAKEAKG
jgi:hypothetical protein